MNESSCCCKSTKSRLPGLFQRPKMSRSFPASSFLCTDNEATEFGWRYKCLYGYPTNSSRSSGISSQTMPYALANRVDQAILVELALRTCDNSPSCIVRTSGKLGTLCETRMISRTITRCLGKVRRLPFRGLLDSLDDMSIAVGVAGSSAFHPVQGHRVQPLFRPHQAESFWLRNW